MYYNVMECFDSTSGIVRNLRRTSNELRKLSVTFNVPGDSVLRNTQKQLNYFGEFQ